MSSFKDKINKSLKKGEEIRKAYHAKEKAKRATEAKKRKADKQARIAKRLVELEKELPRWIAEASKRGDSYIILDDLDFEALRSEGMRVGEMRYYDDFVNVLWLE